LACHRRALRNDLLGAAGLAAPAWALVGAPMAGALPRLVRRPGKGAALVFAAGLAILAQHAAV